MSISIHSLNAELRAFEERTTIREDLRLKPRISLLLPNLRVRQRMHFSQLANDRLAIAIVVENVGSAMSRACDAQATISILGGATTLVGVPCPALPPQSWTELPLGEVGPTPPGTTVNVTAVIDPPTATRPGGQVWESDETDNVASDGVYLLEPTFDDPPLGGKG